MILALFQENVQSLSTLLLRDMHISRGGGGVSSSRNNNCSASHRHGLDQVVDHLCWDGHPLLLEFRERLPGRSLYPRTRLPDSFQMCSIQFQSGDMEAKGEFGRCCWRGTVWYGMLHGVWRCAEIRRHATFDARSKTTGKSYAFLFLNSI